MTDQISFDDAQTAGPATCSRCGMTVKQYWAVDGAVLCERCKEEVLAARSAPEGGAGRVGKAVLFGLGGMVVGALVWYAIGKIAHLEIGLIAILLGFLVGKGVFLGSGKRGGRGYQVLAVVITYLGIGLGMAPLALEQYTTSMQQSVDSARAAQPMLSDSLFSDSAMNAQVAPLDSTVATGHVTVTKKRSVGLFGKLVAVVILVASLPVLSIVGGGSIIGALIYGFALIEAYRLTKKVEPLVSGPHAVAAAG